jgi:vacuolar-type H+-ATPase subunit F/Vma7
MPAPVFIGDEVTGAGYRLAGVRVETPLPGEELSLLEHVRAQAELILVSAECASRIPAQSLSRILAAPQPLVLVVPDVQGRTAVPDVAARVYRQLGMQEHE